MDPMCRGKMPVPDFQSLMLPVLRATAHGEIDSAELRNRVANDVGLSVADLAEMLPSGRQTTFANRVAWANVFLQRARLIERARRGIYRITENGKKVLSNEPARIDIRFLEQFPVFVEWRRPDTSHRSDVVLETDLVAASSYDSATPEERIDRTHRELTAALESDLLDRVREMSPAFFEALIIDLLIAMGYGGGRGEMGKAVGRSGDEGLDGIIREDALGLDVVYMQAKRYAHGSAVGRPEIQNFAGSLDGVRATKGIFISTSTFTSGAKEFVDRIAKRIILIDGPELARLMVEHKVGVRVRAVYDIKKIDEDYFTE